LEHCVYGFWLIQHRENGNTSKNSKSTPIYVEAEMFQAREARWNTPRNSVIFTRAT